MKKQTVFKAGAFLLSDQLVAFDAGEMHNVIQVVTFTRNYPVRNVSRSATVDQSALKTITCCWCMEINERDKNAIKNL